MQTVDQRAQGLGRGQYGLATREQLRSAGISPRTVARRLARWHWRETLPPVIDLGTHSASWAKALQQLLLASGGGHASHWTAAFLHGFLDVGRPRVMDVVVPRGRHPRLGDVRLHTTTRLDLDERTSVSGFPCTSRARTLLDVAAAGATVDDLERFALDLERRRRGIRAEVMSIEARRRTAPGRGRALAALARMPGDADALESPLEVRGVQVLRTLGLRAPVLQYEVRDLDGRVVKRVDAAWPAHRVAVEFDGASYHDPTAQQLTDGVARQRMRDLGWEVVVVRSGDLAMPDASAALGRLRRRLDGSGSTTAGPWPGAHPL